MKRKPEAFYEILLAVIIIAILLLPQLIGTTTVTDESANVDENGCPVTSENLADLEAPGKIFGTLTFHEWEMELQKRFPTGEIRHYNNMSNMYAGLESGEIDAAIGFADERPALAKTHPDLAMIEEPFTRLDFGFATQKSAEGKALCKELNRYLSEFRKSGAYNALRQKWEDPKRDGDVMGREGRAANCHKRPVDADVILPGGNTDR